jgi:hypothetical protein
VALLIRTAPSRDAPTSRLPPRQARRDRRGFRATDNRRTRAPSIGSTRTLRLGRARPRLLFTCMASPRTLSLAAIPSRPVKGRRSASSYPFGPGSSPGYPRTAPEFLEKDASLRLLQPTSLHEHPADCSIPGCVSLRVTPRGVLTPRCARARTRRLALGHGPGGDEVGSPTPLARRANQVELRLTANLQLQPLPQLVTWILLAGLSASFLDQVHQTQRSPGGAAIDSPSAPNLPIRAFSAADRACDEASDALSCDPGWTRIDRRP